MIPGLTCYKRTIIFIFSLAAMIACPLLLCSDSFAQDLDPGVPRMRLDLLLDPAESEALLNKGVEYFNSERYWMALQYLEEFTGKYPAYPKMGMLNYAMGFSYLKLGNGEKAEELLSRAAKTVRNRPDIHLALAHARLLRENYESAATTFETYMKVVPGNAEALETLCNVYIKLEQYDRVETCFEDMVFASEDNPKLLMQYGAVLLNNGKYTEAYEALKEAIRLDPDQEDLDYYLGVAAFQNEDYETAREALDRLESDGTADGRVHSALGTIAAMEEDFGKAEIHFRKSLEENPDDRQVLNNLVICMLRTGRQDEAVALLNKRLAETGNDSQIMAMLVSLYLQIDKYDEARELLETLVEKEPGNADYLRLLALMYGSGLNTGKIVATWRKYLELKPDDAEARHFLAKALKKDDRKEDAVAQYARVVADDPENEEAYREYGLLCEDMSLTQKAIEIYVGMSLLYPDNEFPPARLGMIAEKSSDIEQADEFFSRALDKKEMDELYVYTHLAAIRFDQGHMVEAELLYRRGLERILKHMEDVFMEFTQSMEESGGSLNLMKLIEISEREKGMEEELAAALEGVQACFARRNDPEGELEYFLELAGKYTMNKQPAVHAARLLKENGDPDNLLLGICEDILKIDVKDVEAHLTMGYVYEKRGDVKEAGLAYKRAVESDPTSEEAWNSLVEFHRSRGRLSELLPYAEKKLEDNNQSETILKFVDILSEK